jgi:hypothetical protein
MILRLLAATLLLISTAQALPPLGADYLGGKHYEKQILETHIKGRAAGIFLTTFGDAHSTVRKLACSGKVSELVVHIAPFDRSHAYPLDRLKAQVRKHAPFLERLAVECPGTTIMPSPACEHNHSAKKYKPILDLTRKLAPHTLPVNSVWKGEVVYGYTTEIHLENSRPRTPPRGEYTVSFDGFGGDGSGDFTDADIPTILARYEGAKHVRLWNFRYNGKFGHKDTTPIGQRKHWPVANYLRGHNATMKVREGAVTWPKNSLYKTFADDHGQGGKDNKAMVILPVKKPSVKVFDSNGNHIDTFGRVTPDHSSDPVGARYYSKNYAYQVANEARKRTGSSLIRIENLPLTDADLRSGRFK